MPRTALQEPCTGNSTNISATHTPLHEFRPPKAETSSAFEAITTPIIFVPPTSEQLVFGSTSGKRGNVRIIKLIRKWELMLSYRLLWCRRVSHLHVQWLGECQVVRSLSKDFALWYCLEPWPVCFSNPKGWHM